MQAIRRIVERKSLQSIFVPEEFGEKVEVIILPLEKSEKDLGQESRHLMKLQEYTGFAAHVLASQDEDVWNDV